MYEILTKYGKDFMSLGLPPSCSNFPMYHRNHVAWQMCCKKYAHIFAVWTEPIFVHILDRAKKWNIFMI